MSQPTASANFDEKDPPGPAEHVPATVDLRAVVTATCEPREVRTPAGATDRAAKLVGAGASWRRGHLVVAVALLVAGLLAVPAAVPNTVGRLGSLVETFHVWFGLTIPVLCGLAWWRRSASALLATLLPLVAWLGLYSGHLLPGQHSRYDVTAVQHNVSDENADPVGTARELAKARPDLVALEELTQPALSHYATAVAAEYTHHTVQGTVGLWSRFPLAEARPVNIRPQGVGADWNRGLRAVVRTPRGELAVYVAHLPSVRLGHDRPRLRATRRERRPARQERSRPSRWPRCSCWET